MLTRSPRRAAEPDPGSGVREVQVWFGPPERPLYGWLAVPASGRAAGGVLLCAPVGEEGRASHRTFRRAALALAEVGLVALRLDYDGTGDSAGRQDDEDRVGAWLRSIEAGRSLLARTGVDDVALVGMRLGATLAARAAADTAAYSSLVLWDPCASGRSFLREGEALHRFGLGPDDAVPDDGLVHTPGFQYDAAAVAALDGLDLARLPTARPLAERVLLLARDDRGSARSVLRRLRQEGDRLDVAEARDQATLLELPPSDCLVPARTLRTVVRWLERQHAGRTAVDLRVPAGELPVELPSHGAGTTVVRERSVRFGPAGIYGLVSEPLDAPADGSGPQPWVVLVNVAIEHHIGPGRRWVEFARRWAAQGYRCVRLDQSGVGDSPHHPGQLADAPFAPEWIDDMRAVVGELSAGGAPVIVMGLCSGAYSAFEVALWDRVDSIFAVNPRLTLWPATRGSALHTLRRRAGLLPTAPVARLATRHRIAAGALWRVYRQLAVWHAPTRVLADVARRGTEVEVIACPDDARHFTEVVFWWPVLQLLRRRGLRFEGTDLLDHSLLGRQAQEFTWQRGTAFLVRRHRALAARSSHRVATGGPVEPATEKRARRAVPAP